LRHNEQTLHIGIDDTDSPKGMCTTFLAYKIVDFLKKENVKFLDYPYLIRFNPNIPWKTRGNGAVSIKIKTKKITKIKNRIIDFVKQYSRPQEGANPGLVFYNFEKIPKQFSKFSQLALWQLISRKNAKNFASRNNLESFYLGNGQGLVGAIGAIGYTYDDHTFELISYRKKSQIGKRRKILGKSVKTMQEKTFPSTFNNYDEKKSKILISPHGPDPVMYGIRGENVNSVLFGSSLVKTKEKLDGYMVFKSNQGTADHLKNDLEVSNFKPYTSGTVIGKVYEKPQIIKGSHTIFSIFKDGRIVRCAIYEPTGLSKIASKLIVGDTVRLGGGIRKASKNHPRILNVEFLEILKLKKNSKLVNPFCKNCHKRMKSKGKRQGFECVKCGRKQEQKKIQYISRELETRLYLPRPSAHRHLTRPLQRIGKLNKKTTFDDSLKWFKVF